MMQKFFRLAAPSLVLASIAAMMSPCAAQDKSDSRTFELEPEYVYGRNRGPSVGYQKPEVFDPLNDRLYRSGYKNYSPVGVPLELKKVDAMTRVKAMKTIIACADGWFWPFSRTARNNEPPGLEIELLNTIAAKHGWTVEMMWVNMQTRFGPGAPGGQPGRPRLPVQRRRRALQQPALGAGGRPARRQRAVHPRRWRHGAKAP